MTTPFMKLVGTPAKAAAALPVPSGRWLTLKAAADRAKCNLDGLRAKLVREGWVAAGLACLVKLGTSQTGYEVDEAADPRFAAVKAPEQRADEYRNSREFLALPEKTRTRALQREAAVRGWEERLAAGVLLRMDETTVTKAYVAELRLQGIKAGRSSLWEWRKTYRTQKDGLKALVDAWGKAEDHSADRYFEFVKSIWLNENEPNAEDCCVIADYQANLHGWEVMSRRTVNRRLAAIPKVTVLKYRKGQSAFVARGEPSIARDYTSIASNGWWCSDNHRLDVMVAHDGKLVRPWLHAWEDLRSRKIVAWAMTVESPNSRLILRTFTEAVRELGRPGTIYIDNGDDFDARKLQGRTKKERRAGVEPSRTSGAFSVLGCEVVHAWPFHGQSKTIERQFKTCCDRFSRLWDTYIGNKPENRPEKLTTAYLNKRLEAGTVTTFDELKTAFGEWVQYSYNGGRTHSGHGMENRTCDEVYAECLTTVHRVSDELLEFATFERVGPVTIHKNGITWKTQTYGWADDALIRRLGQKVMLAVDERTIGHVYVIDQAKGNLICVAKLRDRVPFGANEALRDQAMKLKKSARRIAAEYVEQRPRITMDTAELMLAAERHNAAKRKAARPKNDNPPPTIVNVPTPFDDQLPAIRRALETVSKKAVGHEDLDLLRPQRVAPLTEEQDVESIDVMASLRQAMQPLSGERDE